MKPITKNSRGVTITLSAEPSDLPVAGNASAVDAETDANVERMIIKELEDGNIWAWCDVTVTVTYKDTLRASFTLSGCSYKSEKDFRHDNGYFGDLVDQCIAEINKSIAKLSDEGGK